MRFRSERHALGFYLDRCDWPEPFPGGDDALIDCISRTEFPAPLFMPQPSPTAATYRALKMFAAPGKEDYLDIHALPNSSLSEVQQYGDEGESCQESDEKHFKIDMDRILSRLSRRERMALFIWACLGYQHAARYLCGRWNQTSAKIAHLKKLKDAPGTCGWEHVKMDRLITWLRNELHGSEYLENRSTMKKRSHSCIDRSVRAE